MTSPRKVTITAEWAETDKGSYHLVLLGRWCAHVWQSGHYFVSWSAKMYDGPAYERNFVLTGKNTKEQAMNWCENQLGCGEETK